MKDLFEVTPKDLPRLTSKDLLAVYNAHAEKPIERFADHFSGFRRTKALLESLGKLPSPKAKTSAVAPDNKKGKARTKVLVAPVSDRAKVKEYHSVLAAFKALNLPIAKHQRFRRQLKLNGKAAFAQFIFTATY